MTEDYDAAEQKALAELLLALPLLPDNWPPHAVQGALHRALLAYELEKAVVRAKARTRDALAAEAKETGP